MNKIFSEVVAALLVMLSLVMIYIRYKAGKPYFEVFFFMPILLWVAAFFVGRKSAKKKK